MLRPVRILTRVPRIDFMRLSTIGLVISAIIILGTIGMVATIGLNFGIDFRGGILVEVRSKSGPADLAQMRSTLGGAGLGEVALQEFGQPTDVLIRVQRQPGDDAAQMGAVQTVRKILGDGFDYRRVEVVGPKVGDELIESGTLATILAICGIALYVWFRFEWQFGVGAIVSTLHDVVATIGFFALFQIDFSISTVAAVLLIAGYSVNDTVVIYDRIRENLRKYKTMPLRELFNLSVNETLSRTILTSMTTGLAVLALFLFGGEVIRDFSGAMLFGMFIGIYSTLFVAVPLLLYFPPRRGREEKDAAVAAAAETRGG